MVCDPLGWRGRVFLGLVPQKPRLPPCTTPGLGWPSVLLDKSLPVSAGKDSAGPTKLTIIVGNIATHCLGSLLGFSGPLRQIVNPTGWGRGGKKAPLWLKPPPRENAALALQWLGKQPVDWVLSASAPRALPGSHSCVTLGKACKGLQASLPLWVTRGQKSSRIMARIQTRK